MGYDAYLEVQNGEKYPIQDDRGINCGNALATFYFIYSKFDHMSKEPQSFQSQVNVSQEYLWFARLENQTDNNLRLFSHIFHGERRDYSPDEYEQYQQDWRFGEDISETKFSELVTYMQRAWTPIDEVMEVVDKFIQLLPLIGADTYWYVDEDSLPSFQALQRTLKHARQNGQENVRIQLV